MNPLKVLSYFFCFLLLTMATQVGGVVLFLCFPFYSFIERNSNGYFYKATVKVFVFLILYLLLTFSLVPFIAGYFGRVPLPVKQTDFLKPRNVITWLLNRNYVTSELRNISLSVAKEMNEKYPGTVTYYLEANFPFFNHFPLFPHLSHNDGRKLDLSFFYLDAKTKAPTNNAPSWMGYGVSIASLDNEKNQCKICESKGYWQYGLLNKITPQHNADDYLLDEERTRELVQLFASKRDVSKIFIEPELKTSLKLSKENKIRFQGCHSVRHDDHLHIQVK